MFEKVNPCHPDKVADRIAGALVDAAYRKEENPRIAVEVLIGHGVCHIIAETSVHISLDEVTGIVHRIAGNLHTDYVEVPQDGHLANNQADGIRCGDNGIFKGMPVTEEQKALCEIAKSVYHTYPYDGKYILDGARFILCQSNAKIYVKSSTGIKFSDVAGEDEAKELLTELVDYLHNPERYTEIGASLPKGALLVGPPGTGKTLLAKAVAGEANVPFFSISGSEFVEMFVGMGAAKVRDLFKQANEKAPCIVFIDEIDTIGKKRDGQFAGGNDEREQTLNQLLTEMDGFDSSKGVVILAATNRPDSLDPALLRPGRFDRRIPVELPDLKGREEILKVHARKIKISDDVNFSDIAKAAPGASGADLANIVNEAALRAVRDGRKFATQADLEESIEVVIAGYQKKNQVLSNKEKLIVSYHEVGHALVAAMQSHSAPVHKITIIPRTSGALGYTMQVEDGEHYLMSKEELENKIATFTGGRAAEELIFHSITTGASNDIEQATKLARGMITRYGMSQEFGMVAMETVTNQYLGGDSSLTCSFETQTRIDKMVVELVQKQHDKAVKILEENMPKLHELAKYLYEKETITGEEFMRILNTKPRIAMNQEKTGEESEVQTEE